jgi:tetratricopeptide (TPR) repeat protein
VRNIAQPASAGDILGEAYRALRAGHLDEAERHYREALARDPGNETALNNLGALLAQRGQPELGEPLIREAVSVNPNYADAHSNLAVILNGKGEIDAAIAEFERTVALRPDLAAAHFALASALAAKGKLEEAITAYRQAITCKPDYTEAQLNLGSALMETGAIDEAIAAYRQATAGKPDIPEAHLRIVVAFEKKREIDEAIAAYGQAIAWNPVYAEAYFGLGNALKSKGKLDEAIAAYRRAIEITPGLVSAYANLGIVLNDKGSVDEAIVAFRQAIAIKPDYAAAHSNLGLALKEKGFIDDAIAAYRQAIVIKPDFAAAHSNLGLALKEKGLIDEAISAQRRAIAIKPDFPEAHFGLAVTLLINGDHAEGWREYEWRWKGGTWEKITPREFIQPLWQGEDIAHKTLLVHAEQGHGDTLQFVRLIPMLAQRCKRVVLEARSQLVALLRRAGLPATIVAKGEQLPDFDFHLPLLSAPAVLGTTEATIPTDVPYLSAEPARVAGWGDKIGTERGLKVGLVWAGNPKHKNDRNRSIAVEQLQPMLAVPGVRWFSLQVGERAGDLRRLSPGAVADLSSRLTDFAETAAAIANLDLVVTVDTAVAHLAGALGRPVWVLLPFAPDWRWLLGREDSPWYPTARLFRQCRPGDWDEVFARIAAELASARMGRTGEPLLIPVAIGELADKITLLEIKAERIAEPAKLRNIRSELEQLHAVWQQRGPVDPVVNGLLAELKDANETLWVIEDDIRDCERRREFGPRFIELARAVYRHNDRRAELKRQINELSGTAIIEEKSYAAY